MKKKYGIYYQKKNDELMHYGVPGMKWGHRKAVDYYGGHNTKTEKYQASNGIVIGKSKNAGVTIARQPSTTNEVAKERERQKKTYSSKTRNYYRD